MNIPPILRVPIRYGFFGGLLAISLLLMLFYMGQSHPQLFPVFMDYRILLFGIFIFFSTKEFRDVTQQGVLHFWQGMVVGMVCYFTISLIAALFIGVFGSLEESYLQQYLTEITEVLSSNREQIIEKVGIEQFEAQEKTLPLTTISDLAIDYLLKSMFIGLFLTIIISVILRRQPKT